MRRAAGASRGAARAACAAAVLAASWRSACVAAEGDAVARRCTPRPRDFHCGGGAAAAPLLHDAEAFTFAAASADADPGDGDKGAARRCGYCRGSAAAAHLADVARAVGERHAANCSGLVVFSASLGGSYARRRWPARMLKGAPSDAMLLARHGPCFFTFVLEGDAEGYAAARRKRAGPPSLDVAVPLDGVLLPYGARQMRRNVKVLKLLGAKLFPWAQRLLWVDGKLRLGERDPLDFFTEEVEAHGACATLVGLPVHVNTFGPRQDTPTLQHHGENIIRASQRRPNVTEDLDELQRQLEDYGAHYAPRAATLAANLVDSAFIAWDHRSPRCRAANDALGCAWFDEVDCYSDRDQVAFPAAVERLGLAAREGGAGAPGQGHVLFDARGRAAIRILAPGRSSDDPGAHHWYYSHSLAIGKCLACVKRERRAQQKLERREMAQQR